MNLKVLQSMGTILGKAMNGFKKSTCYIHISIFTVPAESNKIGLILLCILLSQTGKNMVGE